MGSKYSIKKIIKNDWVASMPMRILFVSMILGIGIIVLAVAVLNHAGILRLGEEYKIILGPGFFLLVLLAFTVVFARVHRIGSYFRKGIETEAQIVNASYDWHKKGTLECTYWVNGEKCSGSVEFCFQDDDMEPYKKGGTVILLVNHKNHERAIIKELFSKTKPC